MMVLTIVFLWLCLLQIPSPGLAQQLTTPTVAAAPLPPPRKTSGYGLVFLLVKQAIQLQQHAQKLDSLQERVTSLESSLKEKTAQLTALTTKVAKQASQDSFRAVLRKPVTAGSPIIFDPERTSGEGSYNRHTGVYTVSTPGVYVVGFQLFPKQLAPNIYDLYVNGQIRIRSRCYSSNTYTASCASSSVLHLQKGDALWMQSDHGGNYHQDVHSFFFGALVSPDP